MTSPTFRTPFTSVTRRACALPSHVMTLRVVLAWAFFTAILSMTSHGAACNTIEIRSLEKNTRKKNRCYIHLGVIMFHGITDLRSAQNSPKYPGAHVHFSFSKSQPAPFLQLSQVRTHRGPK